uniref:Uncharacterized protein n=1 Tax=Globodera rostochiensis TaxID=31243 RepID=A0A914GV27_GLORO
METVCRRAHSRDYRFVTNASVTTVSNASSRLAPIIEDKFDQAKCARTERAIHYQTNLNMFNEFSLKTIGGGERTEEQQQLSVKVHLVTGVVDADVDEVDLPWILDLTKDLLLTMVMPVGFYTSQIKVQNRGHREILICQGLVSVLKCPVTVCRDVHDQIRTLSSSCCCKT